MKFKLHHAIAPVAAVLIAAAPAFADHHNEGQQDAKTGPEVSAGNPLDIEPSGPGFDWAPDIDPQMQAVIEQFAASEPPMPITQLSPFQFRNATLPSEAVLELLTKSGLEGKPAAVDIAHKRIDAGPDEGLLVRTYTPTNAGGNLPTIVYFHGGGWVIADLDTYDASARALAEKTGAQVVSVAYRLAPEHAFPTAHRDAFAAYQYVVENIGEFGGDASRVAVAGESAGGNLAVATALLANRNNVPLPVHVVSVYPVADDDTTSESYTQYAQAMPLSKPLMDWFFGYYNSSDRSDLRELIDLVDADLSSLPPTTIINAQIDPLASDGAELEQAIRDAGREVERKVYEGVTHEFFGMNAVLEQADEAQTYAADRLTAAFEQAGQTDQGDAEPMNMQDDDDNGM